MGGISKQCLAAQAERARRAQIASLLKLRDHPKRAGAPEQGEGAQLQGGELGACLPTELIKS